MNTQTSLDTSGFSGHPKGLTTLYGSIAAGLLLAVGILAALTPAIRKMIGTVH